MNSLGVFPAFLTGAAAAILNSVSEEKTTRREVSVAVRSRCELVGSRPVDADEDSQVGGRPKGGNGGKARRAAVEKLDLGESAGGIAPDPQPNFARTGMPLVLVPLPPERRKLARQRQSTTAQHQRKSESIPSPGRPLAISRGPHLLPPLNRVSETIEFHLILLLMLLKGLSRRNCLETLKQLACGGPRWLARCGDRLTGEGAALLRLELCSCLSAIRSFEFQLENHSGADGLTSPPSTSAALGLRPVWCSSAPLGLKNLTSPAAAFLPSLTAFKTTPHETLPSSSR